MFKERWPFLVLCMVFIGGGILAACDSFERGRVASGEQQNPRAIALLSGHEITPLVDEGQLREFFAEDFQAGEIRTHDERFALDEVRIEGARDYFYLIGRGKDEIGNCVTRAYQLEREGKAGKTNGQDLLIVPLGPPGHTCTGHECSSCRFTYDEWEEINGCACDQPTSPGGHCDHTIST